MDLRKLTPGGLALAFALAATPPPTFAQTQTGRKPVNVANATVSQDVGMVCQYVGPGPAANATVAVDAATGDLTFLDATGTAGASVVSTFECPVSGAPGGVIDVSDAACNTFGEVVDTVNNDSDSLWRCVLIDALRTDASTSANGILITRAATTGKVAGGVSLLIDSTEALVTTRALIPAEARRIEFYYQNPGAIWNTTSPSPGWRVNPFADTITQLVWASETVTFAAGGPPFVTLLEVLPSYPSGETVSTVYQATGAATATAFNISDFIYQGFWFTPSVKPLIRVGGNGITTMTTTRIVATGSQYPYKPQ